MKKKYIGVVCLCLVLVFTSVAGAVTPRWSNIRKCAITHDHVGENVGCSVEILGDSDATLIANIDVVLKRYLGNDQWEVVYSWEDMYVVGNVFEFYDEAPNMPRYYTYRLCVTAYVYKNGVPEYLDMYHDAFH